MEKIIELYQAVIDHRDYIVLMRRDGHYPVRVNSLTVEDDGVWVGYGDTVINLTDAKDIENMLKSLFVFELDMDLDVRFIKIKEKISLTEYMNNMAHNQGIITMEQFLSET